MILFFLFLVHLKTGKHPSFEMPIIFENLLRFDNRLLLYLYLICEGIE
jgi:hypothetical protein